MTAPRSASRKAKSTAALVDPSDLFWALACDLELANDRLVIDAYALLRAHHYKSFLARLDDWNSQMYSSIGDKIYRRHQLAALLQKYPFEDPSIDRDAVALEKFLRSERKCQRMNQKFFARRLRLEPPHMNFMRNYITGVLGITPNYESIFSRCDFGPGSSVGVHGNDVSVLNKLDVLTVTPAAWPVVLPALLTNHHYASYLCNGVSEALEDLETFECILSPRYVQHNKIVCVPKNAKTSRTIAIEPTLNGFLQKGVDLYMRSKLLRAGTDLSSQSLNQALARRGSRDGDYVTIDLSAASDSISVQLVRELLPPDWFSLLNALRCPSYQLPDGTIGRYAKFCSMGNGFCFPLETLIFRAACEYVMSVTAVPATSTVAVYGDDIIVPQQCALLLLEVLRDIGFVHNESKTFITGGFRESCGADFFFGENVRPIYLKSPLKRNHEAFYLLNELRRRKLMHTWQFLFDKIPGRWRYLRPYPRDADDAITVPMDVFMSSRHARYCRYLQTWTWKSVVVVPAAGRKPCRAHELLIGKLRGDLTYSETFSARFSERTRIQHTS